MLKQPGVFSVRRELLPLREYLTGVRVVAEGRGQDVVVLDNCRDSRRLAGRHLPSLDKKHGPASSIFVLLTDPLHLRLVVSAGASALVPAMDVQVNAEVEEGHGHKRGEELEGRSAEQEVPGEVKLGVALVSRDDALADDGLPEEDGGAVEEEGQHPHRHHLEHSLAGHVPLRSVFNLCQKKKAECESPRCIMTLFVTFQTITAAHRQTG